MLIKNNFGLDYAPSSVESSLDNHPVIRTLYDHADEVTCLDFHPYDPILVSGSRDYTIKFFEYAKPTTKKSFRSITEVEHIRCLHFHPSGDWLAVGTQHPVTRLYDVETGQCFVSTHPQDQHTKAITCVKWAPNGRQFATSSKDGSFKLWDGVTNRCINTFNGAHANEEVCSVMYTKNSKYLLTSGKDSQVRLWELSTAVSELDGNDGFLSISDGNGDAILLINNATAATRDRFFFLSFSALSDRIYWCWFYGQTGTPIGIGI